MFSMKSATARMSGMMRFKGTPLYVFAISGRAWGRAGTPAGYHALARVSH